MNDYFNYQQNLLPGGIARSQPITQSFDAIARAFALLPTPIKDGVTRGFSQSVQVGPAAQDNQAATLGQVKQIVDTVTGNNPLAEGSLQPVFRGSYDASTAYEPMDFVAWNGGLYVNVLASTGVAPDDTGHWLLVVSPINTGVTYYSALSGAVTRPLIAFHNDDYWMLVMDLPSVETAVPGASSAWQRISEDTVYIVAPTITNPADGTEDFFGSITSSAYATGERFTGAHTKTVWQASLMADFASVYAEEQVTSGDLTTWVLPLPDPLQTVWIRVRYESGGFSSDWSPITRVVIANYQADPPTFIAPTANETGWMPGSTLQISAYSPNLTDTHVATSWEIRNTGGTVVWQSLEDTVNLTSIVTPDTAFSAETAYTVRARHIGEFFGVQDWSVPVSFTTSAAPEPTNQAPADLATGVYPGATLTASAMPAGFVHEASQWRVIRVSDGVTVHDSGETAASLTSYTLPNSIFAPETAYDWQVRYRSDIYGMGGWSALTRYTTQANATASLVSPLDTETGVGPTPSLDISVSPGSLTHTATQWEVIRVSNGVTVYDSGEITSGLLSISVPSGTLSESTDYQWRARIRTTEYDELTTWTPVWTFTTMAQFPNFLKVSGTPTSTSSVRAIVSDGGSNVYVGSLGTTGSLTKLSKGSWSSSGVATLSGTPKSAIIHGGYIFCTVGQTVVRINTAMSVEASATLAGQGAGLAGDPNNTSYIWVGEGLTPYLTKRSASNLSSSTSPVTVNRAVRAILFDPATDDLYVAMPSLGDGLRVFQMDGSAYSERAGSPVVSDSFFSLVDLGSEIAAGANGNVYIVRKSDLAVINTINIGVGAYSMAADATYLYIAHENNGTTGLTILRKSDFGVEPDVPVVEGFAFAVEQDADYIYVGHSDGDRFTVLERL